MNDIDNMVKNLDEYWYTQAKKMKKYGKFLIEPEEKKWKKKETRLEKNLKQTLKCLQDEIKVNQIKKNRSIGESAFMKISRPNSKRKKTRKFSKTLNTLFDCEKKEKKLRRGDLRKVVVFRAKNLKRKKQSYSIRTRKKSNLFHTSRGVNENMRTENLRRRSVKSGLRKTQKTDKKIKRKLASIAKQLDFMTGKKRVKEKKTVLIPKRSKDGKNVFFKISRVAKIENKKVKEELLESEVFKELAIGNRRNLKNLRFLSKKLFDYRPKSQVVLNVDKDKKMMSEIENFSSFEFKICKMFNRKNLI